MAIRERAASKGRSVRRAQPTADSPNRRRVAAESFGGDQLLPELIIEDRFDEPVSNDTAHSQLEVWRDHDGTVCAYGRVIGDDRRIDLPDLATFCFDGASVRAIAHPPPRPQLIRTAYHRSVLPLILQASGTQVLHASAVLTDRGVVALCAESGTGKSTLAFGLNRRGYEIWADDAVAFITLGARVMSMALPFELHLRGDSSRFFAKAGSVSSPLSEREARTPLGALFVLKRLRTTAGAEVVPLEPSRAFPAALTHAYCFSLRNADDRRHMVAQYLELIARVPLFELRFGTGLHNVAAVLDEIERSLGQLPPAFL